MRRNTPACAGTTRHEGPHRWCGPEHPRLRGDHLLHPGQRTGAAGTPPPARGPPDDHDGPHGHERNTPACAGTTSYRPADHTARTEHPRLRGDHGAQTRGVAHGDGTPPPARGPQAVVRRSGRPIRNTPACAGTTRRCCSPRAGWPEHPRLRGDHEHQPLDALRQNGTPPPARGPPDRRHVSGCARRNTPACAGTTWWPVAPPCTRAEHPRLRGDHPS